MTVETVSSGFAIALSKNGASDSFDGVCSARDLPTEIPWKKQKHITCELKVGPMDDGHQFYDS